MFWKWYGRRQQATVTNSKPFPGNKQKQTFHRLHIVCHSGKCDGISPHPIQDANNFNYLLICCLPSDYAMPVSHIITISGTRLTVIVLRCLCLVTSHSNITLIFVHLTLSNHVVAASLHVTRKRVNIRQERNWEKKTTFIYHLLQCYYFSCCVQLLLQLTFYCV